MPFAFSSALFDSHLTATGIRSLSRRNFREIKDLREVYLPLNRGLSQLNLLDLLPLWPNLEILFALPAFISITVAPQLDLSERGQDQLGLVRQYDSHEGAVRLL